MDELLISVLCFVTVLAGSIFLCLILLRYCGSKRHDSHQGDQVIYWPPRNGEPRVASTNHASLGLGATDDSPPSYTDVLQQDKETAPPPA